MAPATATGNLTPRAREIADAARALLESEGAQGLSMRAVAERVGIRAPSLYKHFADKQALEAAVISSGLAEWASQFESALERPADPLVALADTYRPFALAHPHMYRLLTERPLPRERLEPGLEERAAAPVIAAAGGDADLGRALWAFAHGMVSLELNDRFPADADLDAAWRDGIDAFRHNLRATAGRDGARVGAGSTRNSKGRR
jgi:AcrR family transcriptional regulator